MSESESDSDAANLLGQFTAVNSRPKSQNKKQCIQIIPPPVKNEKSYEKISYNTLSHLRSEASSESESQSTETNSDDELVLPRPKRLPARKKKPINSFISISSEEEEVRVSTRQKKKRYSPRKYNFDDSDSNEAPTRKSRRVISQINKSTRNDSGTYDTSSDDVLKSSRGRRGAGRPLRNSKPNNLKEHSSRKGMRSSQRHRTATTNMAERLEDDISEVEAGPTGTKYSGARENIAKLAKDNPFRRRHQPACNVCLLYGDSAEKGPLVFCQGCTDSYHHICLGPRGQRSHLVSKVGDKEFVLQCRRCLGTAVKNDPIAPHLGHCSHCKKPGQLSEPLRARLTTREEHLQRKENEGVDPNITVDKSRLNLVDNVMFRCDSCERAFHFSHLPPLSSQGDMDDDDIADERFREYSRRWTCKDCNNIPGEIETLVAWRPVDIDAYIPGYTSDMVEETAKEYLVKWRKLSYFRTSWMPGPWVWGSTIGVMRKAFNKSEKGQKPQMTTDDAIPEDYLLIDIVFDVRYSNVVSNRTQDIDIARVSEVDKAYVKYRGLSYEESVWEKPPDPHDSERWQSFKIAYEDWVLGNYIHIPKSGSLKRHLTAVRSRDFGNSLVKKTQPKLLTGGQLMDYQQDGLNWIYFMWYKLQNAVLADEMGLGKTIQVIAFFATLIQDHNCWPFLVVVPNSTCQNWRQEIKTWAPNLRVVTYYGSAAAKKISHDYELFPRGAKDLKCHIVVTSYENMIDDKAKRLFNTIPWAGLIVDEGHRLKNDKNQLYDALLKINFPFRLLLTGTPLQNNVRELFNILQFCDSSKDAEALEKQYQELTKENVNELHDMIRPYFLRRTKAQVLSFLPPVAQIIVPVSMTVVQKKLYKSILAKNPQLIKTVFQNTSGLKKAERHNLNNILIQLRKCLCHPFVYSKAIEERSVNATLLHRNMVEASSKFQLLELLLPKLQSRGHRVLIFSQLLDFLDIIEDFLDGLGLLHLRLDGSMNSLKKQRHIDEFNAPNSPYFAFLLSTRAGGVGINLASADTVIIMDPDFNPHQDIQALSRAHRIGQQRKVLVFQLMTRGSAEEKIMQIGKKKMALDHVLIERMDAEDDAGVDLESILRHGAEALFEDDTTRDIQYDAQSIDKLLDRSEVENTRVGDDASAESQFSFARVWTNEAAALEDGLEDSESTTPNSTLWDKILKDREQAAEAEAKAKAQTFGRGKRKRQVINYTLPSKEGEADQGNEAADSDAESVYDTADNVLTDVESAGTPVSNQDSPDSLFSRNRPTKARPFKRAKIIDYESSLKNAMVDGNPPADPNVDTPCFTCDNVHPPGYCRLKLAGVEHCGLCGIAHFGHSRTCPHLNSEMQVAQMLGSLKQSTEQRALVDEATKYIRGIRGDLVVRRNKKLKATKGQENNLPPMPPPIPHRPSFGYSAPKPQGRPPMQQPGQSMFKNVFPATQAYPSRPPY